MKKFRIFILMLTCLLSVSISNIVCGEDFSLLLDKDINYYIETDDELRFGYDWEIEENFTEIKKGQTKISNGKQMVTLPSDVYYIWLNRLDGDYEKPFTSEMITPRSTVKLANMYSSYDYLSVFYAPASDEYDDEIIELISYPDLIPDIVLESELDTGNCSVTIAPSFSTRSKNDQILEIPLDISIYHENYIGTIYFYITTLEEEDAPKLSNSSFNMDLTIQCTNSGNVTKVAKIKDPIQIKENGYFSIWYGDLLYGDESLLYADFDGDEKNEIEGGEELFIIQDASAPSFSSGIDVDNNNLSTEELSVPLASEGFIMPEGTRCTVPDDDTYSLWKATKKEPIVNGQGVAGTFTMYGDLTNAGQHNGYPAYYVNDGDVTFTFKASKKHVSDMKNKGWEISDDIATSIDGVNNIIFGEKFYVGTGTLAIQVSKDGKNWINYDVTDNWFGEIDQPGGDYYETFTSETHINTGVYYRVIFAYELKKEKQEKSFLDSKYDYQNFAEVYQFYLYNDEALKVPDNNQQYRLGSKVKTGNNFYGTEIIDPKDKHYGWDLGYFFVSGYTEHREINEKQVFLKNVGDELSLWFNLQQDINELNGNSKLKIAFDTNITDQNFELPKTDFYRGALIIQYTDYQNITHEPVVYVNFLEANALFFTNLKVDMFEEGDYDVALDYSIDKNHYRIAFSFSIRNSNCMVYPFDVVTKSEMTNSSYTDNGFYLDLARSRYLDINVKRVAMVNGVEDVRFNRSARDGEQYTDDGIYIITVKNKVTGEQTEKRVYVGAEYKQYSQN